MCNLEFKHEFHFGKKTKKSITTSNLTQSAFGSDWTTFYTDSITQSTNINQTDNGDLLTIMEEFLRDVREYL